MSTTYKSQLLFIFPFSTDKHASSVIISTDMYKNYISHSDKHKSYIHILNRYVYQQYPQISIQAVSTLYNRYVYQQYPQISIQAVSTLHKDKHMSSIFTSLDKHMSSVYGVHPLSPPNTYPVQRYIPYLPLNRGVHPLSPPLHITYINTLVLYTITHYTQLMYSINRQVP